MGSLSKGCLSGLFYWLLVAVLVSIGFFMASRAALLLAYPFWILAAVLIAFPVAGMLSDPVANLFFPREKLVRKQPMYSIPESLRRRNKLQEAFDAYQEIARQYPREVRPYIEMIRLAHLELKRDDLAAAVHHRGMAVLKKPKDREELSRMYDALVSIRPDPPKAEERRVVGYPGKNKETS